MKTGNKTHILIWVLVVLLVINIAAITTILLRSYDGRPPGTDKSFPDPPRYLHKELGLSKKQAEKLKGYHTEFKDKMAGYFESMQSKRQEILNKLAETNPDTAELYRLAEDYGKLHAQIKKITIDHFMGMKKDFSPQQREMLNEFIHKIRGMDFPEDVRHQFKHRNQRGPRHNQSDK